MNDEENNGWQEITKERCVELLETRGYYKKGTVLQTLSEHIGEGAILRSPWAYFKAE